MDREFTVKNISSHITTNENIPTLESFFKEKIDSNLVKIDDMVEDKIQNPISSAFDKIITPMIEVGVR